MSRNPTVTPSRIKPNPSYPGYWLVFVACPFCAREHVHSAEHADGHTGYRAARCRLGGYNIAPAQEVSS